MYVILKEHSHYEAPEVPLSCKFHMATKFELLKEVT